ncbi:hypothetical protein [Aliiroseovarius crassostreae]|uniref:hypothetical protein n=1 Tax=Aliiroseovarius crassostreae TaxID=154981 RepID=UPI0021FB2701|nr:hypothetical protein [Aliiroseovarius crassostreae]UWP97495.1 hypothetical protein K3X53_08755 [Aliiroseovarius crassostreae]
MSWSYSNWFKADAQQLLSTGSENKAKFGKKSGDSAILLDAGLDAQIRQCWTPGATSSDALRTTVVVMVDMDRDGKPKAVRLASWDGPSQSAADIAYQAARRAVLICGRSGFDLPQEKYGQWRQIEMTFNPDKMRIK